MTILSNHRVHSYKASAARARRDISPKKMPLIKASYGKKTRSISPNTVVRLVHLINKTQAAPIIVPAAPHSTPVHLPAAAPSAPPAIMEKRTITVLGDEYIVELPQGFDIYEGLRRWYSSLYDAIIYEEEMMRNNYEEDIDEDEAWARYEYAEYLCDF